MNSTVRIGIIALLAATTGCSGSGGSGVLDNPDGNIVVSDAATGKVLNTSFANPFIVPQSLLFTLSITENHFAGPYTIQIIALNNVPTASNGGAPYGYSFNMPCFSISQTTLFTSQAVTAQFSGTNANGQPISYSTGGLPPAGSAATGDPCHSGGVETATITDTKGHTVKFYYGIFP